MISSQLLSVDGNDFQLLSLKRRGSFTDLSNLNKEEIDSQLSSLKSSKKVEKITISDATPITPDTLLRIPEIKEIMVEAETEKNDGRKENKNNKEEETFEDSITQDEDEKMFLEYQRCAMSSRRRCSFNDRKGSEGGDSNCSTDSHSSSRRGSMFLMLPDSPLQSPSSLNSPKASPRSSMYLQGEEGRLSLSQTTGSWNRLKRIFKENKLKDPANCNNSSSPTSQNNFNINNNTLNNSCNKSPVPHNMLRRGSCDSQLQTTRFNKALLNNDRTPESLFPSNEMNDVENKDTQVKSDGWARLKKKFKEGKLKANLNELSSKNDYNNNNTNSNGTASPNSKTDSISRIITSSGNKIMKKAEKHIGKHALHNAVIESDLNAVRRIVDLGKCDINYLKPPGLSALHVACAFGNLEIIKLLIVNDADIHAKTWSHISPLQISTLFGNFEVCQYLISHGASSTDVQDGFVHDLKLMSTVLVK